MKSDFSHIANSPWPMKLIRTEKMQCISLIASLLFSFVSLPAQPVAGSFNDLNKEALNNSVLDERVLLTTDRELYLCGENIVFDAITYEGNWFSPVSASSVLYVELYNQDNLVISKGKFVMTEGRGSGKVSIPRDITSGIYTIRAYTNYMKNFGFQQFFTQKMKIVNPFHNNSAYSVPAPVQVPGKCQVFPEGGNLVEGIKSTVGCRFTDTNGNGMNVIARVRDMNNIVVTSFQTYKSGFASFDITPVAGVSYNIEGVNGTFNLVTPLPKPLKSGLIFAVDTMTRDLLRIRIASNDSTIFPVRLEARHDGFVYQIMDTLIRSAGIYEISTQRIPAGVVQLTLTNSEGNLLSNRLLYLNKFEIFGISLKTDKDKYNNRENVEVMISTGKNKGLPEKINLVLVSSLTSTGDRGNDGGYPDAYFLRQELKQITFCDDDIIQNACSDKKLLKLILLSSQKPHSKIDKVDSLNYLPETNGDIVSGKILYKGDRPAEGIKVLQSFTGNTGSVESAITDKNGNFYFLTDGHNNSGDLILKVPNTDPETAVIPDDEFFADFPPTTREALLLSEAETELVSKQFINIQVEDAFSKENNNKKDKIESDGLPFYGKEYIEYKFPDYLKLPNMEEFIFEVIQGVILTGNKDSKVIEILNENGLENLGDNPLIIIDGVPVAVSSVVTGLPSEKVKSIRVVRNKYFYKEQIFDGILDITTYQKDASSFDLPKGTYRYKFIHPDNEKLFIESKLSTDIAGRIPDYKNLLYWNSEVIADKDGAAKVLFIAPDNSGTFEIRCYGLSSDGSAGEGRIMITVGK